MSCLAWALVLAGSPAQAPKDPVEFLKWSMDQYKVMRTYQASISSDLMGLASSRRIAFVAPNRFRVSNVSATGTALTCVCDGRKLVEYEQSETSYYKAPTNIGTAKTTLMSNALYCGSEIYAWFLGAPGYRQLVNDTHPVTELAPEGGLRRIQFWGPSTYGTSTVSIDPATGIVRQIVTKCEPMIHAVRSRMASSDQQTIDLTMVERFDEVEVNRPVTPGEYAVTDSVKAVTRQSEDQQPPVPIGAEMPDFALTDLNGKKTKLSEHRGGVVFLDFWATWCGPCRVALPHTERVYKKLRSKGLKVFVVSNESASVVKPFIAKNKYTFPVYLDPNSAAMKRLGIRGIPTFMVIDAKGRLVEYALGTGQDAKLDAAITRADPTLR